MYAMLLHSLFARMLCPSNFVNYISNVSGTRTKITRISARLKDVLQLELFQIALRHCQCLDEFAFVLNGPLIYLIKILSLVAAPNSDGNRLGCYKSH